MSGARKPGVREAWQVCSTVQTFTGNHLEMGPQMGVFRCTRHTQRRGRTPSFLEPLWFSKVRGHAQAVGCGCWGWSRMCPSLPNSAFGDVTIEISQCTNEGFFFLSWFLNTSTPPTRGFPGNECTGRWIGPAHLPLSPLVLSLSLSILF